MKKELIEKITSRCLGKIAKEHIKQILSEELPDFQRIDEERFMKLYWSKETADLKDAIKKYNSTLPPALVPLPKEMPKDFFRQHSGSDADDLWEWLHTYYGTPEPKPSLPTVEELRDKMYRWVGSVDLDECEILAQNLHEKYSLPTREWWQGDFKGLKVKTSIGAIKELDGKLYVRLDVGVFTTINNCTPYTPPSAQEIIAKHNLSDEEVKVLREGKV